MKREITKIDVGSVAMVYGGLLAAFGLFAALLIFLFGSAMGIGGREDVGMFMGAGAAALVLIPLLYGVLGLFIGAIIAVLYNLITPYTGGIKVYIRDAQS